MQQRNAFTLVELLVVVAIIVALLAILLPSMNRAIAIAQSVQCQSQERQIMLGCMTYSSDHMGALPEPNYDAGNGSAWKGAGWLYRVPISADIKKVETGSLWPLLNSHEIYRCPTHEKPWGNGGRTAEVLTSYVMNGSVRSYSETQLGNETYRISAYLADDIMFWEQDDDDASRSWYWNDGSNMPWTGETARHDFGSGGGNVVTIDGAVEWMSAEEYRSLAPPGTNPVARNRLWNEPYSANGR